jgi:phosphocarrier protein HPr
VRAEASVEVVNERGLHARASAKFVKLAGVFRSHIQVTREDQTVDALSIMGLMMLAAGPGTTIRIAADGEDAHAAVAALTGLVAARFDEER